MCGFTGYVGAPLERSTLEAARDLLTHRGPDSEGLWEAVYEDAVVGLGFRRLRILDPSPAANQPMERDGVRLVYNGEVYNFRELRAELQSKGFRFRSTGDTEVVLAAYREWGLDAIPRLEGMFALAIWDESLRRLVLARDRLGIKPLYFASSPERFVFASEPKAVLALGMRADLNETALMRFLTFLWAPDPDSLFDGVAKLPPGHLCVLENGDISIRQYWDVSFQEEHASLEEHAERLRESLQAAVRRQLAADVPVGAFLSGGVDSTLISTLAAQSSSRPLLGVATGFPAQAQAELGEDDLPYARIAARSTPGLDYREVVLSDMSADLVAELTDHFDDPVADPAAISTYLICRVAKPEATVMLSGVGSEELFAGYPRHRAVQLASGAMHLPQTVRRMAGRVGSLVPGARRGPAMLWLRHAKKFLEGLPESEPYIAFCAHHDAGSLSALLGRDVDWAEVTAVHRDHLSRVTGLSPLSRALYLDLKAFLPSLNLAYVDRASMANSVEVRVPMLDELVVERAVRIPDHMKFANGTGKVVLKTAAEGLIPSKIVRRPKTGFGAPVRTWIRELSGEVIRDCLSERSIRKRGLVRAEKVAQMQQELARGRSDQALQLWALVVLELWARRFLDAPVVVGKSA